MINLGDRVKDPVTGIYGIAYLRIIYLQGCNRIGIQPPTIRVAGKEPIVPELFNVDEPQLVVIKKNAIATSKKSKQKEDPGGPSFFSPRDR